MGDEIHGSQAFLALAGLRRYTIGLTLTSGILPLLEAHLRASCSPQSPFLSSFLGSKSATTCAVCCVLARRLNQNAIG